ncbi:hypothetical protein K431DRAFT_287661 [Polychaeton citri CBS 116435]|uniref:NTF2-like domain-containing protein n=1 Tax=Polychaeton citri CBS 116435 TaxID=1314669 RepID=A0A9P4UM07_9PEZI|nr:hypothetical protein K431DRAFT_287661 [Polychaeton citri CBS 116435]
MGLLVNTVIVHGPPPIWSQAASSGDHASRACAHLCLCWSGLPLTCSTDKYSLLHVVQVAFSLSPHHSIAHLTRQSPQAVRVLPQPFTRFRYINRPPSLYLRVDHPSVPPILSIRNTNPKPTPTQVKMRFAVIASLAASALAIPFKCMSDSDAQGVSDNFKELIANYSDELADAALTTDFTDYSSSVNTLINNGTAGEPGDIPLLSPTFSSLEQFKAGQSAQPPIPFDQLNIWHSCDTVIIRWYSNMDVPVPGIIVMETCPAPAGNQFPYQISTVYSEFNSGAWLLDLGYTCSVSDSSKAKTKRSILA